MSRAEIERRDEAKRLLMATLEFAMVMRRQEGASEKGDSGLGLGRVMRVHRLGTRHVSALLSVALWGPMSVTELARRHRVLVKTASLVAVQLEEAGLIERRADPSDRRRTILRVAPGRERVVAHGLRRRLAPLQRLLQGMSKPQREALISGLGSLTAAMASERRGKSDGIRHAVGEQNLID